jgi:hypothetical protein
MTLINIVIVIYRIVRQSYSKETCFYNGVSVREMERPIIHTAQLYLKCQVNLVYRVHLAMNGVQTHNFRGDRH